MTILGRLKEVWRATGGVGMSGLAISRGSLLTLVQKDGKQWLVALSATTGDAIWQSPLAPEYRNPMGDGPRHMLMRRGAAGVAVEEAHDAMHELMVRLHYLGCDKQREGNPRAPGL